MMDDWREWPFPVEKPRDRWDEFDRALLEFLARAHAAGGRPRINSFETIIQAGAFGEGARGIWLVRRGRRIGWEVSLCEDGRKVPLGPRYDLQEYACICVRPPFRDAGRLALAWMRGEDLDAILAGFEFIGGRPPGLVAREGDAGVGGQVVPASGIPAIDEGVDHARP